MRGHNPAPHRHDLDFVVALDLGQASDYTALSILQRAREWAGEPGEQVMETTYRLRNLERPPLGTRYPAIVANTLALLDRPPFTRETPLVIDRTGVGRVVGDLFEEAGLEPWFITIHGGDQVIREGRDLRVPKRELVGSLVKIWQSGEFAYEKGLALAPTLVHELTNFHMHISLKTGHDSYEAWREKDHDDLVLSVAMASWFWLVEAPRHEPVSEEEARLVQGIITGEVNSWQARGWGG